MGGIGHWTYDCYHHRHRIQDLLDHQLLSFYWRGRNAYYALKNPCPSLQDESESSSLCKKRKTSQIQPPISLKDRLVWPKVKDEDCTEINMICPPIRPQHRNCPDLHNVISQIVQNAPNRPTVVSYQGSAPRSTYLVPVPSQPQPLPLVITIPSASLTAPKVPQTLTLRPIPKPIVITYPPSKGPITISLPQLEPYTGNHAVPWNYGIEATTEQGEKIEPEVLMNAFNSLEKPSLLRKFSPSPRHWFSDDVPWAKGATILFISSIVPIRTSGLVRFLLLSTQFYVFVRDHVGRKVVVEERLWNGDSPLSIEVGRASFPTIPAYY